jgi:5-methylcytosine-specific restriction protein A
MPSSPPRPCSQCGSPVIRAGKCSRHLRMADRQRGSSSKRGYDQNHAQLFRKPVLEAADYRCQWPDGCDAEATVADHHPRTRMQLVADGDNPNDPQHGRALCLPHHSRHTDSTSTFGKSNH